MPAIVPGNHSQAGGAAVIAVELFIKRELFGHKVLLLCGALSEHGSHFFKGVGFQVVAPGMPDIIQQVDKRYVFQLNAGHLFAVLFPVYYNGVLEAIAHDARKFVAVVFQVIGVGNWRNQFPKALPVVHVAVGAVCLIHPLSDPIGVLFFTLRQQNCRYQQQYTTTQARSTGSEQAICIMAYHVSDELILDFGFLMFDFT
jgi:hypothetical protein